MSDAPPREVPPHLREAWESLTDEWQPAWAFPLTSIGSFHELWNRGLVEILIPGHPSGEKPTEYRRAQRPSLQER